MDGRVSDSTLWIALGHDALPVCTGYNSCKEGPQSSPHVVGLPIEAPYHAMQT